MKADTARHARVQELLPWYLASSLPEDEAREVAEHLEACAACRAELEIETRLRSLVASSTTPRLAPHPAGLERVMRRIEEAERRRLAARAVRAWSRLSAGAPGWLTPRRLRLAALVLANNLLLVLAVLAIVRWSAGGVESAGEGAAPRFETRSAESPAAGSRLRVVFRDDVAIWEIVDLLRELDLELVAGPTQVGAFDVAPRGEGDLPAVVEHLRSDPRVRLVAGWP